jgi:hypothetical protein
MHFLQVAIFSIAALAFTASASAVGNAEQSKPCYSQSDCGEGFECIGADGGVSSLLFLVRSELTFNHFTEAWTLPTNSMVGEFSLTWNED